MIECKIYNLTELKKLLSISDKMWKTRKEELLDWLSLFFDYEITTKGRGYQFNIKEQYCEYEPMPRKNDAKKAMAFYQKRTDEILSVKPRNTGANLAREIVATNNECNHKEDTAASYIRPYLKKNYTVHNKEWCQINYDTFSYDKISDKQLKDLNELFEKHLDSKTTAEIMGDTEAGYTSKEEAYDKLRVRYLDALEDFKMKYGFRPYKAGELLKNAWVIEDEDQEEK